MVVVAAATHDFHHEHLVFDYAGVETTMSSADYWRIPYAWPGRVVLAPNAIWPTGVRPLLGGKIRWAAGFVKVPDRALQAMRLLVGHWFENREAVTTGTSRYCRSCIRSAMKR